MTVSRTIARNILKDEFTANGITANNEILPDVLGLSNGGFVVAYQQASPQPRIALDFYNAQFNDLLGTNLIGSVTAAGQPSLTQLINGNVLVVWEEDQPGDAGLRGQIYSPTGSAVGGLLMFDSSTTDPSVYSDPQVIALAGGGFALAATFHFGANGDEIILGSYDSAGNSVFSGGGFAVVNHPLTGNQNDASIGALPDGRFIVTWTDSSGATPAIRGQIYKTAGGIPQGDNFTIDQSGSNTQSKVVGVKNGYAVAYVDTSWAEGGATGAGITLLVAHDDGGSFTLHVNTPSTGDESDPDIALLSNGNILVTWTYPTGAGNHDVRGRLFGDFGVEPVNGSYEEFTITASPTDDTHSAVGTMASGRLISVWQDSFSDGDGGRIGAKVDQFVRTSIGNSANDNFVSDELRDIFTGGGGDNRFVFAPANGNDTITDFVAGAGTPDKIDLRTFANIHSMNDLLITGAMDGGGNFIQTIGLGGRDSVTLINPTGSLNADDFILEFFAQPATKLAAAFNPASGWTSQDQFPRHLADVNGDGSADIVGFGNAGVYVSLANGSGGFAAPVVTLAGAFNPATGWTSDNAFHRELADVNGDGMADIVGFGNGGVYVSLATGGGNFAPLAIKLAAFNPNSGWTSQDQFPRELADVDGDGRADIVGYGNGGVYVALATGFAGNFATPKIGLAGALNPANGWTSQDQFPRELADVNGDGAADIVGFGNGGAYVALANGDGTFTTPFIGVAAFNPANGWTSDHQFLREVADVNHDRMADIVGFGNGGVYVSLATGDGLFAAPIIDIAAFNPANGWTGDDQFHRAVADVNHDGSADIVGFGTPGVLVALNNGFML